MQGSRSKYVRSLSPSSRSSSSRSRSRSRSRSPRSPHRSNNGGGLRGRGRGGGRGRRPSPRTPAAHSPGPGHLHLQKAARSERFGSGRAEDLLGSAVSRCARARAQCSSAKPDVTLPVQELHKTFAKPMSHLPSLFPSCTNHMS